MIISKCLWQTHQMRANPLVCLICNVLLRRYIPRRTPMSRKSVIIFRKYSPRIGDDPDQMAYESAANRDLEASWGRMWGGLGWPKGPPGCILGCEDHVPGSPLGDVLWHSLRCSFVLFFFCPKLHPDTVCFYKSLCYFVCIFDIIC